MISKVHRNPFIIWVLGLLRNTILEFKYRNHKLTIRSMSSVQNSTFGNYNVIYEYASLKDVSLGDLSYIGRNTQVHMASLGKFCSVGPDCKIGLGIHPAAIFVSTHPIFFSNSKQTQLSFCNKSYYQEHKQITIGHDVWIGARAIILDGVTIGNGAIVGAGALVTKNIPAYAIVGGVPAKILRYRFEPNEIEFLQKYKWWDKDINWLRENFELFHNIKKLMQITENHERLE